MTSFTGLRAVREDVASWGSVVGAALGAATGVIPWIGWKVLEPGARIGRLLGLLRRDESGNVAVIAAIALPALAMLAAGSIDLAFVMRDKAQSQNIADAAALMGAKEMAIASVGAADRAKAYAMDASKDLQSRATVDITVTTPTDNSMKVVVHTHRNSFFGNLLPPGGFHTYANATATSLRQAPLCVIATDTAGSNVIDIGNTAKLTAACLVHSDRDIRVNAGASLTGKVVEAVTSSSGTTTPTALTGVQAVGDPFGALDLEFPTPCLIVLPINIDAPTTLPAGTHCFNYEVKNGHTLTLATGIHYFGGDIALKSAAKLISAAGGVTVVMGPGAEMDLKDGSDVSLTGSESGKLAGFVLATTRDYNANFTMYSNPIKKLTGAIYLPSGKLTVEGTTTAASSSDWTVVAAKSIRIGTTSGGSPNLVINANYAGSLVPVPSGVGPNTGSRLSQ